RDEYLGTPEQVVQWMSRAEGAPDGGSDAYMRGVRDRVARSGSDAEIDVTSAIAFLESLRDARLLRLEERRESSTERVAPKEVLDEGPVAFGDSVTLEDLAAAPLRVHREPHDPEGLHGVPRVVGLERDVELVEVREEPERALRRDEDRALAPVDALLRLRPVDQVGEPVGRGDHRAAAG